MTIFVLCKDCGHQWSTGPSLITCPKCGGKSFVINTAPRQKGEE